MLFQLAPSMPSTDAIGSGLLPTPDTQNHRDGSNLRQITKDAAERGSRRGVSLHHHVAMWPTPEANERNAYPRMTKTRAQGQSEEPNLAGAVKMWPTPKGAPSGPDFARANREGSGGDDLATAVARIPEASGQLNPQFVEWLMGFPQGWTDLKHSETP